MIPTIGVRKVWPKSGLVGQNVSPPKIHEILTLGTCERDLSWK